MRGIEQGAIGAIVDEQLVAAPLLHPHQHAGIVRAQRPARLAPQLRRVRHRQRLEAAVDHREIGFQRRRLHARIARRKAAAHIDHIDGDTGFHNRRAGKGQRIGIGLRCHRLRADMEADAERIRRLPCSHEQGRGIGHANPELGCQAQLGMRGRHAQTHAQREIGRRRAIDVGTGANDLVQLFMAVQREDPHAQRMIGFRNRFFRLHRVHEGQHRLRQQAMHQPRLGDRGHVELADAAFPQQLDKVGRRIRLHRIEALARKS